MQKNDQTELAIKAKNGDHAAKTELVVINQKFIAMIARQYSGQGMLLDDLIQEGNLGLLKAIELFNPILGNKFLTYASWWIKNSILSALSEHNRQVRLPVNRIHILEKYRKIKEVLSQELQRDPSEDEILDILGEDVSAQYGIFDNYSVSYNKSKNIDSDIGIVLEQLLTTEQDMPDSSILLDGLQQELSIALKKLKPKEREILQMCYGLGMHERAYTLGEIGEKFNLSRERIRQIKHHALKTLRRMNRRKKLEALKN